jgi:recombination protein RecA
LYLEQNPNVAAEIEMAIREKAGVISKKIEGNPIDPEKAAKDQEERTEEIVPSKKN